MSIVDRFNSFAADFEKCVGDDQWSRLGKYFVEDATYLNVGGPDPKVEGREAIIRFLKNDVERFDRRFDSRTLEGLTEPTAIGKNLSRKWRCTFKLRGAPDLVTEGTARYEFSGTLIRAIEEEITPESMRDFMQWMKEHGSKLNA
jgi:hypothetical protein